MGRWIDTDIQTDREKRDRWIDGQMDRRPDIHTDRDRET